MRKNEDLGFMKCHVRGGGCPDHVQAEGPEERRAGLEESAWRVKWACMRRRRSLKMIGGYGQQGGKIVHERFETTRRLGG
jgi:hypothetical protein